MARQKFRILHVNTMDIGGGAARVANNLSEAYRAQGHLSWSAVGHKFSDDPNVLAIQHEPSRSRWTRSWLALEGQLLSVLGNRRGVGRIASWFRWWIGQPGRSIERQLGHEDFNYPGSHRLMDLPPQHPDIVHFHNLHGDYFDLRALQSLSQVVPVVLTLHDAWLLSGHCSHSFDCDRWRTGCGACPDLSIYPAIRRDGTAFNWQRKRAIYANSQIYVATPSQWLMQKVKYSMLAPAVREARVIHNGVHLSIFHPAEKEAARQRLELPKEAEILLFTADGIRRKAWRDYELMRAAVALVSERLTDREVIFIGLGEEGPTERSGQGEIRFVRYQTDPSIVAGYYAAADVYMHASRADTFPTTVLEALACGTPVVATRVGGLPEQIRGLPFSDEFASTQNLNGSTGILTSEGSAAEMADAVVKLLTDSELHSHLSKNAIRDTQSRFDLRDQAEKYLSWYGEILTVCREERPTPAPSA